MDKDQFKDLLERNEGRRDEVYTDTEGHPTVGVGFNLDRDDARSALESIGLDYDKVRDGSQKLTDNQIDTLLDRDADTAIADAHSAVSNFDELTDGRQIALADMAFNLGGDGLSGFTNTLAAIQSGDWEQAAQEMENSRWYEQTGNRAVADIEMMRSGQYSGS